MKHPASIAALVGACLLVGPASAQADGSPPAGSPPPVVYPGEGWPNVGRPGDPVVSVGGLFSYTGRESADDAVGAGVEGSFAWYGQGSFVWIGAVAQAQLVADRPVHERLALGFQGGFGPIGAELSMYTEGAGPSNARTYGAQIVPFIGIPIAYAGFRLALPFNEGNGATMPSYGTEYGLVIGLKFPINPKAFGHSLH